MEYPVRPYTNPMVEHIITRLFDGTYAALYSVGQGWVRIPPQPTEAAAIAAIEAATR